MPHNEKISKENVADVVREVVEEDAADITDYLYDKERISEFVIAEEVGYEIHKARYLLYKMLENNIATFIRKKDRIKGWYICYWTLDFPRISKMKHTLLQDKINKLQARLDREQNNQFYMCSNACVRQDFDKAVENNYKCPECGEIMNFQENKRTIQFLKQQIEELEQKQTKQLSSKIQT
jgi:transcription initiation factor TFIIE subunit alpha